MEEFNTIEKVEELFKGINALGNDNIFFVACQDKQKVNGMAAGMEYPYDGLLINDNYNVLFKGRSFKWIIHFIKSIKDDFRKRGAYIYSKR